MVRNFGERRKKSNKRGHQQQNNKNKSSKSRGPRYQHEANISQEEVTCREVAIYVPPPFKLADNKPKARPGHEYRARRENRRQEKKNRRDDAYRQRVAPGYHPQSRYYDDYYDDDEDDDDDDDDYHFGGMMNMFMGMRIAQVEAQRGGGFIVHEVPLAALLLSALSGGGDRRRSRF